MKFKSLFEDVIKTGQVSDTVKIGKLKIELRALSEGETDASDAATQLPESMLPYDLVQRYRLRNRIATATVSVNGEATTEEDRKELYEIYSTLPNNQYDKLYDAYQALLKKQAKLFDEADANIKDF